jgi:aryl-phospho-beta-D-glucosidase BglC (GH1 family)
MPSHFELGVNLSGAESSAPSVNGPGRYGFDYTYPSVTQLDYFQAKGLTLVRLPFSWERIEPDLGSAQLSQEEVARIGAFLDEAHIRGMKVVLDLHNYGRYFGEPIGSEAVPIAAFADVWFKLASEFKDHPAVYGYGIMNEPHDMGGPDVWPTAAQEAVDAIRAADADQADRKAIIVSGDAWSGAWTWKSANADLAVSDPADNVLYEAHQYFDRSGAGVYAGSYDAEGAYPGIAADRLKPFLEWLDEHDAKGFVGEIGVPGDDPRWLEVLDSAMALLKEHDVPSTYWLAGPWSKNDPLSVEPRGGEDRPQLEVLTAHDEGPIPESVDTLVKLRVSGDAWHGDPILRVFADGREIGRAEVVADHAAEGWQEILIGARFGDHPPSRIDVSFVNDAAGKDGDRNLYVDWIEVDGQRYEGERADANTGGKGVSDIDAATLHKNGTLGFDLFSSVKLRVSADSYLGDPEFALKVDGKVIGTATVSASHASGEWQEIEFRAPADPSKIEVVYLNDKYGGTAAYDRNFYIDWIEVDGERFEGESALVNTAQKRVTDPSAAAMQINGTMELDVAAPLKIRVAGDAWQGDPQFAIAVDGVRIGPVHAVTADHAAGEWNEVLIDLGRAALDASEIEIVFVNDAWGGAGKDRNLYVDWIEVGGVRHEGEAAALNTAMKYSTDPDAATMQIKGSIVFNLHADDYWIG